MLLVCRPSRVKEIAIYQWMEKLLDEYKTVDDDRTCPRSSKEFARCLSLKRELLSLQRDFLSFWHFALKVRGSCDDSLQRTWDINVAGFAGKSALNAWVFPWTNCQSSLFFFLLSCSRRPYLSLSWLFSWWMTPSVSSNLVLNATILVQQPLSLFFSPQIDRSCHEMTLSCNKMIWYNDSWMNHSTFPSFILITNMLPSIDTNNTSLPAHSGHSGLDNILLHHCISGHLILKTPWTTTLSYNRLLELHQSSLSWCRYFHSV